MKNSLQYKYFVKTELEKKIATVVTNLIKCMRPDAVQRGCPLKICKVRAWNVTGKSSLTAGDFL